MGRRNINRRKCARVLLEFRPFSRRLLCRSISDPEFCGHKRMLSFFRCSLAINPNLPFKRGHFENEFSCLQRKNQHCRPALEFCRENRINIQGCSAFGGFEDYCDMSFLPMFPRVFPVVRVFCVVSIILCIDKFIAVFSAHTLEIGIEHSELIVYCRLICRGISLPRFLCPAYSYAGTKRKNKEQYGLRFQHFQSYYFFYNKSTSRTLSCDLRAVSLSVSSSWSMRVSSALWVRSTVVCPDFSTASSMP